MMPVPGEAGRITTLEALKWAIVSWAIVPWLSAIVLIERRAITPPLRIASGTSLARPMPKPTRPWPSPTTTMAVKEKRRPPLTTLATRLMWTTFSM